MASLTPYVHSPPMNLNNMFYNGKPQSGSPELSGTCLINHIKPFKYPLMMFF